MAADRTCLAPRARALLAELETRFGRLVLVSTCRPGAVIAGTGRPSLHRYGKAIDFFAPRGRKAEVVRWLIGRRAGGVMTYRDMAHIHADVGRPFVRLAGRRGDDATVVGGRARRLPPLWRRSSRAGR